MVLFKIDYSCSLHICQKACLLFLEVGKLNQVNSLWTDWTCLLNVVCDYIEFSFTLFSVPLHYVLLMVSAKCAVCSVMSDSLPPPWTVACQAPLYMRILQARRLEWAAMPSSSGSSPPRDHPISPALAGRFFTTEQSGKPCVEYHISACVAVKAQVDR